MPFENGLRSNSSRIRFSAIVNSPTMPPTVRSSGTKPMPVLSACLTLRPSTSLPLSVIEPSVFGWRPRIASVSSVWPLPCTPATTRISPSRMSKLSPSTSRWPVGLKTVRSRTWNDAEPSFGASFCTVSDTSWPTMSVASSSFEAVGSAVPTTLPRRMTVMRSLTWRTSRSLCEMKTIEVPCWRSSSMMRMSSSVSCGVSTAVGSSSTSTFASCDRALMISTRCCWPTERSSTTESGSMRKPKRSEISFTRLRAAGRSRMPAPFVGSWPSMRFSATVKTGMSMKCWCTIPMPARIASPGPEKF